MEKSQMKNLKLNYHLLEGCNYGCKFCFARYADKTRQNRKVMETVVQKAAECGFFSGINFAGGEPFLVQELANLIRFEKQKGLSTSVIPNGSFLTKQKLDEVLPFLDCIGISFHSVFDETKINVGACTKNKKFLTNESLQEICDYIRKTSNCKIKINTIVNSCNKKESIAPFIKNLSIDRWKILRSQSFGYDRNMLVSDSEWNDFCKTNEGLPNTVFENNMKDTYIMVDSVGNLLKENLDGNGNQIIGSVLALDMESLLLKHPLHVHEYSMKYSA